MQNSSIKKIYGAMLIISAVLGNAISITTISFLGNLSPYRIMIILGTIINILILFNRKKIVVNSKTKQLLIIFLVVLFLIKNLFLMITFGSIETGMPILLNYIFGFLFAIIISSYCNSYSDIYYLLKIFFFAYIFVIVLSLYEVFTGQYFFEIAPLPRLTNSLGLYYPANLFYNTNNLSTFLCMGFPLIWAFLNKIKKDILTFPFLIVSLFISLCTEGRASMVVFLVIGIVMIIYYFINSNFSIKKRSLIVFMIFLTIFIVSIIFKNEIEIMLLQLSSLNSSNNSVNTRIELISTAIKMLEQSYFLGIGLGNFSLSFYLYTDVRLNILHNLFVEFLLENGVFLFALLIIILLKFIINNYRKLKKEKDMKTLRVAFLIIFILLPITTSIMSSTFAFPLLWILFGLMNSLYNVGNNGGSNE